MALSGNGRIHSYTVHHHPPLPGFAVPHPIVIVALDEGIRMMGAMDGTPPEAMAIDLPVSVEFLRRGDSAAYRFRLS
ncbi:Zn-ribbon domain-containing OB-fold protein [Sphingomonas profundi]|uniref:Zn-ribbon domain-containing OB-fold protein n=1 Tax=Alterirhizorhabdus profundi TaxID=2681549 RepID=UPI001E52F640|nr:OB-fold domain-containing protein [Sphingomonas profundi]